VDVGVDQAWHHHPAFEIDHLGVLTGDGFHVLVGADSDEFAVLDSERLRPGSDAVHRVDETAAVHHIRPDIFRLGRSRRSNGREATDAGGQCQPVSNRSQCVDWFGSYIFHFFNLPKRS